MLIPLSTSDTSGLFHSHCKAHSAGLRRSDAESHSASIEAGSPRPDPLPRPAGEQTPAQRLHGDDAQALFGRILQPTRACLVLLVQEVVLDLAKGPAVIPVDNVLEKFEAVVEREAEVADASVRHRAFGALWDAEVAHTRPRTRIERMQQVEVDLRDVEPGELLVQKTIEVVDRLNLPARQLRRDLNPLAITVFQRPAHKGLTRAAVVWIGCVDIIDAVVDGISDQLRRLLVVDLAGVAIDQRQPHGAKAQRRRFPVKLAK